MVIRKEKVLSLKHNQYPSEFEQNIWRETERKYLVLDGTEFEQYKPRANRITQIYLSSPEDEYGLRVREISAADGSIHYTATIKDRGVMQPGGLSRMEIETPISEQAFRYYSSDERNPRIRKERAEVADGITIDWIENHEKPIVEIEWCPTAHDTSTFLNLFSDKLQDRTGDICVDNEQLAYAGHTPDKRIAKESPTVEHILHDLMTYRSTGQKQLVIGIAGRSGSGKSTLARELRQRIKNHPQLGEDSTVMSTDDYHKGRQYLESTYGAPWTNWDDARVYDTALMARDIARYQRGETICARELDFSTIEPVLKGPLPHNNILIIEGIHAGSCDLAPYRHMFYEVQTPLSVSLGRDLKRLLTSSRKESASMSTPEERLRYMLEVGEPTYRTIERKQRNIFPETVRPLGRHALTF